MSVFDGGGSDAQFFDGGSRWGVKGSAEAGEGLTAVYRFEHKINTAEASLGTGGRLSFVGLSGGFGTVTVGQIWSATYNSAGAITDNSWFYGNSKTSYRHGNAVSYAFSNNMMSLQTDVIYGESGLEDNPNDDLEKVEFGLTVNLTEIGKIALAHTDNKYAIADSEDEGADGHGELSSGDTRWRIKTTTVAGEVSVAGLTAYVGSQNANKSCTGATTDGSTFAACDQSTEGQVDIKEKATFFGVRGGLGDTGLSYVFQWVDNKSNNKKPWILNLSKGLGDSATLVFEHADNDGGGANKTAVALAIGF